MSDKIEKMVSESRTFETALRDRDQRFSKLGWCLCGVFGVLLGGSIAANIIMQPLKTSTVELYVMNENSERIARIATVDKGKISEVEAVNLAETASYVKRREGYNYFALQKDYDETQLFNSPDVNNEYLAWYSGPEAPDVVFKKAAYVATIEVISNVHSAGTKPDRIAMMRIKRTIRRVADNTETSDYWTIRMTYRYVPQVKVTETNSEINPLGFMVTSYQRFKEKA